MCVGAAFIFGLLYMLALRCLAGCVIWFSIVMIFLTIAAGGVGVYYYKDQMYEPEDDYYKYATYTAYALWGLAGLFVLLVLCMCSRIRLGIAIYKTTALFMRQNCSVFLVPFAFVLIIAVWVAFWCVGALWLFSIGELQPRDDITVVSTIAWTKETRYFFLYNCFALLWVNAFFIGLAQFTVAAACAMWYFTWQGDVPGSGSVLKGLRWGMTKHLGSIAFGSCIIAIVQFIRYIFEYYR
jgi:Plasma-membrane choline transporter